MMFFPSKDGEKSSKPPPGKEQGTALWVGHPPGSLDDVFFWPSMERNPRNRPQGKNREVGHPPGSLDDVFLAKYGEKSSKPPPGKEQGTCYSTDTHEYFMYDKKMELNLGVMGISYKTLWKYS
jgi:hypothetical protein